MNETYDGINYCDLDFWPFDPLTLNSIKLFVCYTQKIDLHCRLFCFVCIMCLVISVLGNTRRRKFAANSALFAAIETIIFPV